MSAPAPSLKSNQRAAVDIGHLPHSQAIITSSLAEDAGPRSRSAATADMHADPARLQFGRQISSHQHAPLPPQQTQHRTQAADDSMAWRKTEGRAQSPPPLICVHVVGTAEGKHDTAGLARPRSGGVRPAHATVTLPRVANAAATATAPHTRSASRLACKGPRRRLALASRRQMCALTVESVQSAITAALSGFRDAAAWKDKPSGRETLCDEGAWDAHQRMPLRMADVEVAEAVRGRRDTVDAAVLGHRMRGRARNGALIGSSTTAMSGAGSQHLDEQSDVRHAQRCYRSVCAARHTACRRCVGLENTYLCVGNSFWCRRSGTPPCWHVMHQHQCSRKPCVLTSRQTCRRSDGFRCFAPPHACQHDCMQS